MDIEMSQRVCYPVVQGGKSAFEGTVHEKLSSNFGPSDVRSDGLIQESANDGPGWTTDLGMIPLVQPGNSDPREQYPISSVAILDHPM